MGGGLRAIPNAGDLAKLGKDDRQVRYLDAPRSFRDQFLESLAADSDDGTSSEDAFSAWAGRPQQQLADALFEVHTILSGPSIQARCLECPRGAPAPMPARDRSLLALVEEWLS